MPILDDELNREWVQMLDDGPNKVLFNDIRASLVAFLAFSRQREARFSGTGFIIAGAPKFAVALTAKHVLAEGVLRQQRPESSSANEFSPRHHRMPDLDLKKLNVIWRGKNTPLALTAHYGQYRDELDLAACVLIPPEDETSKFEPLDVPLDLRVPSVGDNIIIVAFDGLDAVETEQGAEPHYHIGQRLMLRLPVGVRKGTVTGVFVEGLRHYHWPCITTSIPAEPGMSGGFAFLPRVGEPIAAMGVICADNSTEESRKDLRIAGDSIVALSWPALNIEVPTSNAADAELLTLYDMMVRGRLRSALGIERYDVVTLGGGGRQLRLRG